MRSSHAWHGSTAGDRATVNNPLRDYRSFATARPRKAHKVNLYPLVLRCERDPPRRTMGDENMRTTLLIERYRRFAARTRVSMALLALSLFAAIGLILCAGASASHAAFLDSEARNVARLDPSGDLTLIIVVALVFAAVIGSLIVQA